MIDDSDGTTSGHLCTKFGTNPWMFMEDKIFHFFFFFNFAFLYKKRKKEKKKKEKRKKG